ncbi:MAG: autotransporter domain-containing protein [Synechococcaceae bacterium WB6_3B_236]|nr:autotransporter domain-containing protein [Synechococcaceae bacterium WB6_3B_236]
MNKINRLNYCHHLIVLGGGAFLCNLALAQQSNTNANNAVPARSATLATSQAITNVIIQNPFSGSGAFRFRLGEQANPQESLGMAAGEDSNWSVWATPVVSSFKNNIAPYTSSGRVALALAGIEYNHNDVMITGVSLAVDSTNSDTNYNGGTYKSTGTTLSPYLVYQINNAWMTDWSLGFGSSKPTTP